MLWAGFESKEWADVDARDAQSSSNDDEHAQQKQRQQQQQQHARRPAKKEPEFDLNSIFMISAVMLFGSTLTRALGKIFGRYKEESTDSCIYKYDASKFNPSEGELLGEWEA